MSRRLIHKDPLTGISEWFTYDRAEDTFAIHSEQDVTSVAEGSKAQFNSTDERAKWGEWAKVATIPLTILHELRKNGTTEDPKRMKAWLNSRDNRVFRTRPGRV
jgi:hypothetical protein